MANYLCLILLSFFMLISIAAGTQFKVGGSNGWSVPDTNAMSYSQWAEKNRFKIGDSLCKFFNQYILFCFHEFTIHYANVIHLKLLWKDNCEKNEKIVVVVMADRSNSSSLAPAPLPASASSPPPPYGGVVEEPTAQPPPPNGASSRVVDIVSAIGAVLGALSYVF
ncbi:hypothetical protein BHM03_00038456 [Ensete ventricosum]|nr:hypothetical protein BHM03_00038456 [Ensete ventricosum]